MNFLFFLSFLFLQTTPKSSPEEVSIEYKAQLKELFIATNLANSFQSSVLETISIYKKQYPKVPASFWESLQKDLTAKSLDDLTNLFAPVYIQHLTAQDLQQVLGFYHSPAGKKYANSTPKIMKETILIGQNWAMELQNLVLKKLIDKGHVKDDFK